MLILYDVYLHVCIMKSQLCTCYPRPVTTDFTYFETVLYTYDPRPIIAELASHREDSTGEYNMDTDLGPLSRPGIPGPEKRGAL